MAVEIGEYLNNHEYGVLNGTALTDTVEFVESSVNEDGETYLFVNACKDEMRFSFEGWNSQETAEIETICQEMGFSLS